MEWKCQKEKRGNESFFQRKSIFQANRTFLFKKNLGRFDYAVQYRLFQWWLMMLNLNDHHNSYKGCKKRIVNNHQSFDWILYDDKHQHHKQNLIRILIKKQVSDVKNQQK